LRFIVICQSLTIAALFVGVTWATALAGQDSGQEFHDKTSLSLTRILQHIMPKKAPPPVPKEYPGARRIMLPLKKAPQTPIENVLTRRRSVRDYTGEPLSLQEVERLCWAASGISLRRGGILFRTAPSAGALYPLELYLVANRVESLPKGIYHYNPPGGVLEEVRLGDFARRLARAALAQDAVAQSAATFVITGIFARSTAKYDVRGYRYVYMEAGHASQNLCLMATSLELGTVTIGAFMDKQVNDLLGVDGVGEAAIYLQPVGKPEK
jgi:SagB-type dehydrogenase family enzyme